MARSTNGNQSCAKAGNLAMRFVLASYGTRGDVEPFAAVGRALLDRGHEVCIAVPPNLVDFAEAVGIAAFPYGPDYRVALETDFIRNLWKDFPRNLWSIKRLIDSGREVQQLVTDAWPEMSRTLTLLADGADVLVTGMIYEELAANVAEYQNIPLAIVHVYPIRVNGKLLPIPSPLGRAAMAAYDWVNWRGTKKLENAQRAELGLPKVKGPLARRSRERGWLEVQAYDEVCIPGLAGEWADVDDRRPFVGSLTMELPTEADEDVASWIAGGPPPIFFGFGSQPVESGPDTVAMIGSACAELGERALICAGWSDLSKVPHFDHVKVVDGVNYAAVFPSCRAVVHHGGTGAIGVSLRAGVPMLILWMQLDQQIWAARVKRLGVGAARRFWSVSQETLVSDLRTVLEPQYASRARQVAAQMPKAADSVAAAADLIEQVARK